MNYEEQIWNAYNTAAVWVAQRRFAGVLGDPLPHTFPDSVVTMIKADPALFALRVQEAAAKLLLVKSQDTFRQ